MRVPIFDADNHLYETEEALTKFLPDRYKNVIRYVEIEGRKKLIVRNKLTEYIPNPTFDYVAAPGAQEEYYRKGNPDGKSHREIMGRPIPAIPAFRAPGPRLELMDEQGLDRTLMFPTLASLVEERLRDDLEATHVVIHSLNEWLYETWQYNYEGLDRIFTTPIITLPIVEKAIEELEWVVERGARAILIRPAPVPNARGTARSFALPEFDPFWEKVVEHDLLVTMHASDSGYEHHANWWDGAQEEFLPFQTASFRMFQMWRPVEDALASFMCHGALSRFPTLKVAIIENGSTWLRPTLDGLAAVYKKMPHEFAEDPFVVFKRQVHISPFWEEDLVALADYIGEDNVLFGSDYPHPEGLGDPRSYLAGLSGASEAVVAKIMGGNLARLMNVSSLVDA